MNSYEEHITAVGVCACALARTHLCMPVCVKYFSSARKLLRLYPFTRETVSPSGFDENSPVSIIDKRCPIEI